MTTQQATLAPAPPPSNRVLKAHQALEARLRQAIDGGPAAVHDRLDQLDREWTTGRATKVTAGVLLLAGLTITALAHPWGLALAAAGGLMLLPYLFGRRSLTGELFHLMGLRTGAEIEREKTALRALRGDYQHLPTLHQIEDREDITRLEGEGGIVYEREEKLDPVSAAQLVAGATRA